MNVQLEALDWQLLLTLHADCGKAVLDRQGVLLDWDARFAAMFWPGTASIPPGSRLDGLLHPSCRAQAQDALASAATLVRGHWRLDTPRDGTWITCTGMASADGLHLQIACSEVHAAAPPAAQSRDLLTGLLHREGLLTALTDRLAQLSTTDRQAAMVVVDLDQFSTINDTLGQEAGDTLLVRVAHLLDTCRLQDGDLVARLGDDEFALVLFGLQDAEAPAWTTHRILQALATLRQAHGGAMASAGIGIARFPADGHDAHTLLRNAQIALRHAKRQGRGQARDYQPALQDAARQKAWLDAALRQATEHHAFELHYQPLVAGDSGRAAGLEVLLRWRNAQGHWIPPDSFIPLAEVNGLIVPIGEWVLDQACAQLARWHAAGRPDLTMAVNISVQQLHAPQFLSQVMLSLERHGLQGQHLELEITESQAMREPEAVIATLRALRTLGLRLSIDDFGTGYSSLGYLRRLPIHTLKLDRSLVQGIATEPSDLAICTATIALAHQLGLRIVAEGVETEAQRDLLVQHGCDQLQGYLLCRPRPAAELAEFLGLNPGVEPARRPAQDDGAPSPRQ